jgi:hypothetical protein
MRKGGQYSNGGKMRVVAYIIATLNSLVWAYCLPVAYAYSKVAYLGGETGACCTVRQPEPMLGALALIFPTVVLSTTICLLLSGSVHRRPGIATLVFLVLLPIGVVFTLSSALAVTPL